MAGTLDAASQSVYTDPSGAAWTYFQDHDEPGLFYVVPAPALAVQQGGAPQLHLTEYVDGTGGFLSAQCQLTTVLAVPAAVVQGVQAALQQKGVAAPRWQALPFIDADAGDGAADPNRATFSYADAAGTLSRSLQAVPSLSGSQTAVFHADDLSENESRFLQGWFGGETDAGTVQGVYRLTAWARLGPVTARVRFDAQAAYEYQRTYRWVS